MLNREEVIAKLNAEPSMEQLNVANGIVAAAREADFGAVELFMGISLLLARLVKNAPEEFREDLFKYALNELENYEVDKFASVRKN